MKALIKLLVTAALFFTISLAVNWILGDPNDAKELLRTAGVSVVFGIVMYPTSNFIDRHFGNSDMN